MKQSFQKKLNTKLVEKSLNYSWSSTGESGLVYAKYYESGGSLEEIFKNNEEFIAFDKKLKTYLKAFRTSGMDSDLYDFSELIPDSFYDDYSEFYSKICESLVISGTKPENYDFLAQADALIGRIAQRCQLLEECSSSKLERFKEQYKNIDTNNVKYNLYGSKTGRLSAIEHSFPIMTMKKEFRELIIPENDYFVELDFNSFEPRVFLSLSGHSQPQKDLHDWNNENIFNGLGYTREKAKEMIFSWLYDDKTNEKAGETYNKTLIKEKFWNGFQVSTPFGRKIESDEYHAVNYVIQSTAFDLFMRQVLKIDEILRGCKSVVSFMVHDSVILDFHRDDVNLLKEIKKTFSDTEFGLMPVNISIGKNYGNLKKVQK